MVDLIPVRDLMNWFRDEARDLPWRETEDPYAIWVSEIMLQQTRVGTVTDYYEDFLRKFPTVEALADATQDEVLKAWEGMGFYARARRLHKAAGIVVDEYDGQLPDDYEELTKLPGIGEYTASAVMAFAFNGDRPVMDGNVKRVVSRIQGIDNPIDRTDTEQRIQRHLSNWLQKASDPGVFSEALIELGALICTPSNPDCGRCPASSACDAYINGLEEELPVTGESKEKPHYEIAAGVIMDSDQILIARRPEDKMLGGLWEFPGGKQEDNETLKETLHRELEEELGIQVSIHEKITKVPHEYSHLSINLHAYSCELEDGTPTPNEGQELKWIQREVLRDFAFPKANKTIVEKLVESTATTR